MRYWPVPSLTALRTFSIRTGLDASTVTPGSSAPDVSLTVPVMACAQTTAGAKRITSAAVVAAHTRPNFPNHENDSILRLSICVPSHAEMPCEWRMERTYIPCADARQSGRDMSVVRGGKSPAPTKRGRALIDI